MGDAAEQLPRRATYADLEAVPPHKVVEIIRGTLHAFPRPALPHAQAASELGAELVQAFGRRRGGPRSWRILDEPELHFGPEDEVDVLVPDLAGWRLERLPRVPAEAFATLAPDWICEVLSPSTEAIDRADKMPIYAREGVRHAWLVDPIAKTLEVFALGGDGRWIVAGVHRGDGVVRAEPFEALELDLALLWAE